MAVCNKEQAKELLELGVLFGPCRISVDDVDQSNMACGRVLVVEEMGEADISRIVSWLDAFESSSEDDIIVNIEEISRARCEEQFNEITRLPNAKERYAQSDLVKFLEVRDYATLVPVMAVIMHSNNQKEQAVIASAGFSRGSHLVMMQSLLGKVSNYDYVSWGDRTLQLAHKYIQENWDSLSSGDVVDVEYILGESDKPKVSEIQGVY